MMRIEKLTVKILSKQRKRNDFDERVNCDNFLI